MKRWPIVFVLVCVAGGGTLGTWKYFQIQKAMAQGGPPMEPMEAVVVVPVAQEPWQPLEGAVGTLVVVPALYILIAGKHVKHAEISEEELTRTTRASEKVGVSPTAVPA